MATAPSTVASVAASHTNMIMNVIIKPIYSRSPLVVEIGRNPLRFLEGHRMLINIIATSIVKMPTKKIAVGTLHAIHSSDIGHLLYTRPRAKPLAM